MDIREISSNTDSSRMMLLRKLYNNSGSCVMNGFIGDSISSYSIDDVGNLQFESSKVDSGSLVNSTGTVLSNSVVIKQVQKSKDRSYNHLFSWDVPRNLYTYVLFDDEDSMNHCYSEIKSFDMNLCEGDISTNFKKMGVSFDNISQILLNQKVDSVSSMLDEAAQEEFEDKTSFTL